MVARTIRVGIARLLTASCVVAGFGIGGCDCSDDAPPGAIDAGRDAGSGVLDAAMRDAGPATPDTGVMPTDSGPADAGFDAGTDAGFDAGTDAGFDAGTDAGFDAGTDAGFDAGLDAGDTVSCQTLRAGGATIDGVYALRSPDMGAFDGYCDMTTLGGGWTLVASYPLGSPAVPAGWASAGSFGTFTSTTDLFKMTDATIQVFASSVYRVRGRSTMCLSGACSIDQTLFWPGTCLYSATSNSTACSNAFLDVALTMPTPAATAGAAPCSWHWGLVDTVCGSLAGTITSHDPSHGISVCVAELSTFTHGCQGRGAETAGVEIWAR